MKPFYQGGVQFSPLIEEDLHGINYFVAKRLVDTIVRDMVDGTLLLNSEPCPEAPTYWEAIYPIPAQRWCIRYLSLIKVIYARDHEGNVTVIAIEIPRLDRWFLRNGTVYNVHEDRSILDPKH